MSIESDLKKEGIEVIKNLDTLQINSLAHAVADKICKTFSCLHLIPETLFIEFSRLPMYFATMPEGLAEANYFYKNSSVYFKENTHITELEKYAIHEFIHHLQEIKDEKGNLVRLGLYEFGEFKSYGLALNEGAVQLATAKILDQKQDIVKYYDISFPTNSPTYYPILCNLVKQLGTLVGENILFESTFFATDQFKLQAIKLLGKKNFFKIQENLDLLLVLEEKIAYWNIQLCADTCEGTKAQRIAHKIANCKLKIKSLFLETQTSIYTSYFNNEFCNLHTTEEIEVYRTQLYNYKNFIGITQKDNGFNEYYINQMALLDEKYEAILGNVALVPIKNSLFFNLIRGLKKIFGSYEKNENYF